MADAFSHIPQIRIQWLTRLAKHHQQQQSYAEAAQAFIAIAELTADAPRGARSSVTPHSIPPKPSIRSSRAITSRRVRSRTSRSCMSSAVRRIRSCCCRYITAIATIALWRALTVICTPSSPDLIEANSKQSRMLGTYCRIAFYGKKFGERLNASRVHLQVSEDCMDRRYLQQTAPTLLQADRIAHQAAVRLGGH